MNTDKRWDFEGFPEVAYLTREDLENQIHELKALDRKLIQEVEFLLITGGWESTPAETLALLDRARKESS